MEDADAFDVADAIEEAIPLAVEKVSIL